MFDIKWKTDYAGVTLWFGLLGFEVGIHLYKDMYWDIEKKVGLNGANDKNCQNIKVVLRKINV